MLAPLRKKSATNFLIAKCYYLRRHYLRNNFKFFHFFLFIILITNQCASAQQPVQEQQSTNSFNSPAGRVKVTPECRPDKITIHIQFNSNFLSRGRFTDWILVGENQRSECRLRGNGELRYVVQIAVFNDPCQTKIIAPGIFQNTLRIAQFPGIVLQDDFNFTFKCILGLPEVIEFRVPQISPTFDINRNVITGNGQQISTIGSDLSSASTPLGILNSLTRQNVLPIGNAANTIVNRPIIDSSLGAKNSDNRNFLQNSNKADLAPTRAITLNTELSDELNRISSFNTETSSSRQNNLMAILLSVFIIITVLIFLLCIFICLRQLQRNRFDYSAQGAKDLSINAPLGAMVGGQHFHNTQSSLITRNTSQARGAGHESSITTSASTNEELHLAKNKSFVASNNKRARTDRRNQEYGHSDNKLWWIGKGNQSYLLAENMEKKIARQQTRRTYTSGSNTSEDANYESKRRPKYAVRAVDVPQNKDGNPNNNASTAFRDALQFAQARSTELMRTPQSYAEWREKTLKRGRGSNGADLLLESEVDSDPNVGSDDAKHFLKHQYFGKPAVDHFTLQQAETPANERIFDTEASFLSPSDRMTPVRSISEVYHAAEVKTAVEPEISTNDRRYYNKHQQHKTSEEKQQTQNVNTSTLLSERNLNNMVDEEEDIMLHSSDEGEYSIPRTLSQIQFSKKRIPAPRPPSPIATQVAITPALKEKLAHSADAIRGFGPRKLTEQEIARWRQLIRGNTQLQQEVLNSKNLEELKVICELSEYRLYFTRTKWTQIMECVADTMFSTNQPKNYSSSTINKNKSPPSYSAVGLLQNNAFKNDQKPALPTTAPPQSSQLNLKLNLFKTLGFTSQSQRAKDKNGENIRQSSPQNLTPSSRVRPVEKTLRSLKNSKVNDENDTLQYHRPRADFRRAVAENGSSESPNLQVYIGGGGFNKKSASKRGV